MLPGIAYLGLCQDERGGASLISYVVPVTVQDGPHERVRACVGT